MRLWPLIVGLIGIVLGATVVFKYENVALSIGDQTGRYALIGMSSFVVLVGALLIWAGTPRAPSARALAEDYGLKITFPLEAQTVASPIELRGTFQKEPPDGLARIGEYIPNNETYWPKSRLILNRAAKTWSIQFLFGGSSGGESSLHRRSVRVACAS